MRDVTLALDQYRIPILSEKESLSFLSLLLRDSCKTEEALAREMRISRPRVKNISFRLFKGGLVRPAEPDEWSLTEYAERLLASIGVSELARHSLLTALQIPEWHSELLSAGQRSSKSWDEPDHVLRLLRVIYTSIEPLSAAKPEIDHHVQEVVHSLLCPHYASNWDFIARSADRLTAFDSKSSQPHSAVTNLRDQIAADCRRATEDAEKADAFILHAQEPADQKERISVYLNVFWRLLDAASYSDPDETLLRAYVIDPDLLRKRWIDILHWEPKAADVFRSTVRACRGWRRNEASDIDIIETLRNTLDAAVEARARQQLQEAAPPAISAPEDIRRWEVAIHDISDLRREIESGHLRHASPALREELLSEIALLSEVVRKSFGDESTNE